MKEYQYVLFDLDGTLTDPKIGMTKSIAYALQYLDINVENLDTLCKFIGPPLQESFEKYYHLKEEQIPIAIEKYREYFSKKGIFENEVYRGIDTLLKSLRKKGKTLILATSKPEVFALKILEHFQLRCYFDFVAGSELDGTRSQKGEVIQYAFEKNNITNLNKVVMVGDRKYDSIGAKEAGITSIGVLYGYGDRQEHERVNTDFIVSTVEELSFLLMNK